MKTCLTCGKEIVGKNRESKKYCGYSCYGKSNIVENPSKATLRKRSQRSITKASCESCGGKKDLQIHHETYRDPVIEVVLCQRCHKDHHMNGGSWGKKKKVRVCVICQKDFLHGHSKQKTCSRECFQELGRINAQKNVAKVGVCKDREL